MAKRPVQTFHPLQMAKSLEAQNEAVGMLLARVTSTARSADAASEALLREMVAELGDEAERVRAIMWPEGA